MTGEAMMMAFMIMLAIAGAIGGLVIVALLWPFIPAGWWMLWTVIGCTVAAPAGVWLYSCLDDKLRH